jgi:hypothetical protein
MFLMDGKTSGGEHPGRADRGMAGERDFARWCEDAQARAVNVVEEDRLWL